MPILRLVEESRERLVRIPESGMGFQIIRARVRPQEQRRVSFEDAGLLLVLNAEYVVPFNPVGDFMSLRTLGELGELGELPEQVPGVLEREPELVTDRIAILREGPESSPFIVPLAVFRTAPLHSKTHLHQAFFRYSAFYPDHRVRPDGAFVPGTYATTFNDSRMVPSGLAAVGRYALPNPLPASHVYILVPQAGTPTIAGAVVPNFNQAGGGVEIQFPSGAQPDPGAPHQLPPA